VASCLLLRASTLTPVPFLCHPFFTYSIAMFFCNVGLGIPDVTAPLLRNVFSFGLPSHNLFVGAKSWRVLLDTSMNMGDMRWIERKTCVRLAGAPSTIMPTRRLGGASRRCLRAPSAPIKFPVSFSLYRQPTSNRPLRESCLHQGHCRKDTSQLPTNPGSWTGRFERSLAISAVSGGGMGA
jgi:hypothetical protein